MPLNYTVMNLHTLYMLLSLRSNPANLPYNIAACSTYKGVCDHMNIINELVTIGIIKQFAICKDFKFPSLQ